MFVATTASDGQRAGCLVGFVTQCSIDPVRFLVCLSEKNHTTRVAEGADKLALHLVPRERIDLARLFGEETSDEVDKFERCSWTIADGVPVLDGCPNLIGRVIDRSRLGDHIGYEIELVRASTGGDPSSHVTFQDVRDLEPGHGA